MATKAPDPIVELRELLPKLENQELEEALLILFEEAATRAENYLDAPGLRGGRQWQREADLPQGRSSNAKGNAAGRSQSASARMAAGTT